MGMGVTSETVVELEEILDDMKDLLRRARELVADADESVYQRAKSYWLAHITMALDDDHGYLGKSTCTMRDTIDELGGYADDYACPGCGCVPGDGLTEDCNDDTGCGWARSVHGGTD